MDLSEKSETNDLYSDGGFPHIRLCIEKSIETEKARKEFNTKNIMSIKNILDRRRNVVQLPIPIQSRTVIKQPIEVDDEPLEFNYSINDISNLNVAHIISKRSVSKKTEKKPSKKKTEKKSSKKKTEKKSSKKKTEKKSSKKHN